MAHNYYFGVLITGVAVGSGWQSYVAYINLGCYYLIGVPLGFLMGWGFHQGVMVRILFWSANQSQFPVPPPLKKKKKTPGPWDHAHSTLLINLKSVHLNSVANLFSKNVNKNK